METPGSFIQIYIFSTAVWQTQSLLRKVATGIPIDISFAFSNKIYIFAWNFQAPVKKHHMPNYSDVITHW